MDDSLANEPERQQTHQVLRRLAGLVIGFVSASLTLSAIDQFGSDASTEVAVPFEVVLGEPDVDGFCSRENPQVRAVATSGDAFGWRCIGLVERLWTARDLDVDDVCRWQYGAAAFARLTDEAVADGWVCAGTP